MPRISNYRVVLVACANGTEARKIALALVTARLAACVNILEIPVQSIYRWKGAVESAREALLVIKTSSRRFRALEAAVRRRHSYDTPEIISLPIVEGSARYLAWIAESVAARSDRPARPAKAESRRDSR
ncbi:MAG: divalent-cation tolerance protein CutA [Candidatus Acidiferrales bacterium]